MKQLHGLWWPETLDTKHDELFRHMLRRVTDVDVAMQYVKTKGVAVQAGGFIGMWPRRLARFFEMVYTFEPVAVLRECLIENTKHQPNVIVTPALLGPHASPSVPFCMKSGGRTTAVNGGSESAPQLTIDMLNLVRCDAIYLDVERYELEVLKGAEETLRRFKPVVTLEVKDDTLRDFDQFMAARGYSKAAQVHADAIYIPIGK